MGEIRGGGQAGLNEAAPRRTRRPCWSAGRSPVKAGSFNEAAPRRRWRHAGGDSVN